MDQAGNRSITAAKAFRAPFVVQKDFAKAVFGTPSNRSTGGTTALGLIAGDDFDADGHPDFALADHDSGKVSVRRNTLGKGLSYIIKTVPFLANSVDDLASGKISNPAASGINDSRPDLVVASNATLFVKINQGLNPDLQFTSRYPALAVAQHYLQHVAVADLNRDGFADIAVVDSSTVNVLLNNGTGTFGNVNYNFLYNTAHRIAVGDLNGDGKLDMAVATQALFALGGGLTRHVLNIEILCGQGGGVFTHTYTHAVTSVDLTTRAYDCSVAIKDLNRDGKPDIVTGTSLSSTIHILHLQTLKNSQAKFLTFLDRGESTVLSGGKIRALALADLNADGKADIISTNTSTANQTSVLFNTTP